MEQARFLHDEAIAELQERLNDVNRTFTNPAIVTDFPKIWGEFAPNARIVPVRDVLDLKPGTHDLVVHAMGLHWVDDPVGQVVQCARALQPDGLFLSAAFGGNTLTELRQSLAEAETQISGGLSPRVAPMAEVRDMGALLQRAGLALPVADTLRKSVTYSNAIALMHDLRAMGETNALVERPRTPATKSFFVKTAQTYSERFAEADGKVPATFEIIHFAGWAPHPDQPKPKRPGSAKVRLADALGVKEHTSGDSVG